MIGEPQAAFGDALRALRLAAGHSQESLAALSGISPREINYLETGRVRHPRRATVAALADALQADAEVRQQLVRQATGAGRAGAGDLPLPPVSPEPCPRAARSGMPRIVPSQLPPVTPHTVGLDRQLAAAASAAAGGSTVVVCGMPGVGKTTFAVRLASRLQAGFPDGHLFADLHGFDEHPASSEQVLGFLIRSLLGSGAQVPPGADERSALLRSILAARRVLLVLDNARDEAQLRPLLPASAGCAAIVTSRSVLSGLDARHRLHLDVLSAADATSLLERIVGDDRIRAEPRRALEVIDACGGLPLALRIVAARLATRPGLSLASMAGLLADQQSRIGELAAGDTAVGSAFGLSYRMLADPERLLFRRLGLNPVPDFSTHAAAALAGLPEPETVRLLEALADVNLLEPGSGHRYRMHDLLRLYARQLAGRADQQAAGRLSGWYIATSRAASSLIMPAFAMLPEPAAAAGIAALRFGTAEQAAAWLETERAGLVAATLRAARHGPLPPAWLIPDALRGYFFKSRGTEDQLMVTQAGLSAARTARDRSAVAAMLIGLGQARASRCQYRLAISHYRQAAALAEQWPRGYCTALGNLGIVYYLLGQLDQARAYYQLSLQVNREIGNRQGEAVRLGNLAGVYHSLCQFPEAERNYTQALAIYHQLGNRHGEALITCNYANTCRDMGNPGAAVALADSALSLAGQLRSTLVEALAQISRAAACMDLGRLDDALRSAQHAVSCSRRLGDGVVETNSLNVLGDVERSRGDAVRAALRYSEARGRAGQIGFRLGEIDSLIGLAKAVRAGGRTREASQYARQAVRLAAASGYRLAERQARACLETRPAGPGGPGEPGAEAGA